MAVQAWWSWRSAYVLRELYGGSAGEGPRRPLSDVGRDVRLVLVAQEVVGETHRGEVDFLQQAEEPSGEWLES